MKKLLLIMLTGLSFSLNAAELDSISLITPVSYTRPHGFGQNFKSSFLAGAAATFNVDIEKKVVAKIAPYKADLAAYFPRAGELDTFVKSVVQAGIKAHLGTVNDANLIKFYGYLGNNLIGKIADKILDKQGVKDAARRNLWIAKLTKPFNECIGRAQNSQYDANHCVDALTASLVPSAGIGIVYELSRSSLNPNLPVGDRAEFNNNQVVLYKNCIGRSKGTAGDVTNCALVAMKSGVLKVTDISLSKTLNEKASSPAKANAIKKEVWPDFERCTITVGNPSNKAALTDQFMGCIDNLTIDTGELVVKDKISSTGAVQDLFTDAEIRKLSADKSAQFKKCAEAQKAKGARAGSMLDISVCENSITNEVTYKVVTETLRDTASKSIKGDKARSNKLGNDGVALLDKCWSNRQTNAAREACLRRTIVGFSQSVASIKLDAAIPAAMPGRVEMTKSSVSTLGSCIEKALPSNITESNDLQKRIDSCSGKLTRSVALKVAEWQIRDTAKGNLIPEETNDLVYNLVTNEFAKCIGNSPDDEELERCSNQLTVKAAKKITEVSFAKEVNAYLTANGGLEANGLTQAQVDSFLVDLNKTNKECIDKKPTGVMIDQVNSCIKNSIKKIAFFFGETKFNKSIGKLYDGRENDKKAVEEQFKKILADCLAKKDGKEFTINDYTKNLYTCSESVSSTTTLAVGDDQVSTSLNQYLKDRPGVDLSAKRNEIKTTVLNNFKTCMAASGSNQNACIDTMKKEATRSIVLAYGRTETKAQLNADTTPTKLKPVEDTFIACTDSKLEGDALQAHLDECIKNFALSFAKELGSLKLVSLMQSSLGTAEFNAQKKKIDSALTEYNSCLEGLRKYNMNDGLTEKLSICTDGLTRNGLAIVRGSLNSWMTTDQKDAETTRVKREFANFLPCLSVLLPSAPYSQQLQANVDSAIKPMAIYIAQYIEYDPDAAKQTLDEIIKKLSIDLGDVAATKKAKEDLLDFLYKSGALDQFIKSMVRGTVKETMAGLSDKDLPKELKAVLLEKKTYEEIFNTPEGLKIKDAVMAKLLKPALLDGADMKGPLITNNTAEIKDTVIKLLIDAPSFGETAIKMSVQKQIKDMGAITKVFAKVLYGKEALDWEKVRLTDAGKAAEEYIRINVLTPKFKGTVQTEAEKKKAMAEAEALVTKAVKSYKSTKK